MLIAPYVISGVLFTITAGCAHGVVHWLRKARAMSRWPTVPGTITSTWDTLETGRIQYSYKVGGRSYTGKRVFLYAAGQSREGRATSDRTPQELTELYPPGAQVTVYYDPTHPSKAVLEPRNRQNLMASVLFMVATAAFGSIVLLAGLFNT
jgi:hypothetical protein